MTANRFLLGAKASRLWAGPAGRSTHCSSYAMCPCQDVTYGRLGKHPKYRVEEASPHSDDSLQDGRFLIHYPIYCWQHRLASHSGLRTWYESSRLHFETTVDWQADNRCGKRRTHGFAATAGTKRDNSRVGSQRAGHFQPGT